MEIETLAEIEINEIDKIGPKGLSAYEVYVKNGGTLSETEWLESLRGEQGLQGKPGAVKMQVVDTLPDVGETDTIYLVKKNNPGEQNLYDEYVYTETSGWEHIGDTSVDLTDYYTKEETDEKLNNKQNTLTPGDNITIENNVISASGSGLLNDTIRVIKLPNNLGFDPYSSGSRYKKITDSNFVENVNSILTDIYNLNRTKTPNNTIILFTMPSGYNDTYFGFTQAIGNNIPTSSGEQNFTFNIFIISCVQKTTKQALFGYDIHFQTYIENNQVRIDDERITKSYNVTVVPQTWASGAGNRAVYETDGKPLGILNTTEFTPTKDYHPSTKKYVDDLPKSYAGYDATKTQVLKNANGTLTWVDEG